jgi:DDE family transposase
MLTAVGHVRSHLIAAAVAVQGPKNDHPFLPEAVRQAARHIGFRRLYADAGYDSEKNHRVCRDELGIESVIKLNRRGGGRRWPRKPYRRAMRRAFPREAYRQRAHAESIFSALKRTLGSALRARRPHAQLRELLWRVLAYDAMILRRRLASLSTEPVRPL